MTEQEATKELERHIQFLRENWKPNPDYNVIEALGMAINALGKQIAKKPFFNDFDYECPYCSTQPYEDNAENKKPLYCSICGQKLDWSEV